MQPATCLLGDTFGTWRASATISGSRRLTSANQLLDLSPTERDQIVLAAHQSSHDDVTTAEEALARFDSGEVNLIDATTADHWVQAIEYGAGDNSYGAIFYGNTLDLAASIQDGDLYGCTLLPPVGGAALGEEPKLIALNPKRKKLKKLRRLRVARAKKMKQLPAEVSELAALEELGLWFFRMKELPRAVGKLKKLSTLDLYSTHITNLPAELTTLPLRKITVTSASAM